MISRKNTSITIPSNIKYLGNYDLGYGLNNLPPNCLFHKGKTGCGGTTIALTNNKHYVISVPTQGLVDNKVLGFDGKVIGFHSSMWFGYEDALKQYLRDESIKVKKIIVTHDSLPKVIEYINDSGLYDTKSHFSLLVDEYHTFILDYDYKKKAIDRLLSGDWMYGAAYKYFNEYCFMTATPLMDERYTLEEFKDLDVFKCEWEDVKRVKVILSNCKYSVLKDTVKLVNRFLNGEIEGNAYFFVNSVDFIKTVVKECGMTDKDARAIWSKSNTTTTNVGLRNGESTDPPKKINFMTRTCFEGQDFLDEDGKTFIISDPKRKYTLLDISTSVIQIVGRIRNSKYNHTIEHIFKSSDQYFSRFNKSREDFTADIEEEADRAKSLIDILNKIDKKKKGRPLLNENKNYIRQDGEGEYYFDRNMFNHDMYAYFVRNIYSNEILINDTYSKNSYDLEKNEYNNNEKLIKHVFDSGISFKEAVEDIERLDIKTINSSMLKSIYRDTRSTYAKKFPYILKAIDYLGYEEIRRLKFKTNEVKRKLDQRVGDFEKSKIQDVLIKKYNVLGRSFTGGEIKKIIEKTHRHLNIKKNPKGKDIIDYFNVKDDGLVSEVRKGVPTKVYHIISPKLFFENTASNEPEQPTDHQTLPDLENGGFSDVESFFPKVEISSKESKVISYDNENDPDCGLFVESASSTTNIQLPKIEYKFESFDDEVEPIVSDDNIPTNEIESIAPENTLENSDTIAQSIEERSPEAKEATRKELSELSGKELSLEQSEKLYNHPSYAILYIELLFPKKKQTKEEWSRERYEMNYSYQGSETISEPEEESEYERKKRAGEINSN